MLPTASVVVPAYNAEATIEDCVRSLLALDYPRDRLELVVVDDGSRDRTRAPLEAMGDAVVVVAQAQRGRAAARNAGVRVAHGEVIAFTDADCTVEPAWLSELVAPLSDPAVGIAGGTTLARPGAGRAERYGEVVHDHRKAITVWKPPYVTTANWASRREVLEEAGLFDESLRRGSDVDLSYRIGALGYKLVFRPGAVIRHANRRTAAGLVLEGWQHGFHGVTLRRRHAAYIARAQAAEQEPEPEDGRTRSLHGTAFRAGKRLGRLAGRLRRA